MTGRLTKHDVEELLGTYDTDPVAALTVALRRVLGRPGASWPDLLAATGWDTERLVPLLAGELDALDGLATALNELRTLPA